MLVLFDYTIQQLSVLPIDTLTRCVDEFVRAHRHGHHVVVIKRDIARWLLEHLSLSMVSANTLNRLQLEYTQSADLVRRSPVVMKICPITNDFPVKSGKFIELNAMCAATPYVMDRTIIVMEDAVNDKKFYDLLFHFAKSKIGVTFLAWEPAHGGGSRTIDVAFEKASDKRIVCAVFDSDNSAPCNDKPNKVSCVEAHAQSKSWSLLFAFAHHCRELENFVPYSIVKQLPCALSHSDLNALEKILDNEQLNNSHIEDLFWLYFDVKNGFSSTTLSKITSSKTVAWWMRKIQCILDGNGEFSIQGFGNNVTEQLVNSHFLRGDLRRVVHSHTWWDVFGDHLSTIMWLCVSSPRQFA